MQIPTRGAGGGPGGGARLRHFDMFAGTENMLPKNFLVTSALRFGLFDTFEVIFAQSLLELLLDVAPFDFGGHEGGRLRPGAQALAACETYRILR